MKGKGPSRKVGEILPGVLKGLGLDKKVEETKLLHEWSEIVGEAVARRSRPRAVREGMLLVVVENNVWMHEIRFHSEEILGRIREKFPGLAIKGIRLELDRERDEE